MFTVVETPTFQRLWPAYWTEEERGEFAALIAENPVPVWIQSPETN